MKKQAGPFVMLSRDLLRSDAWRGMGVNEKRLIDFLMIEHMEHGGKENGRLLAPWNQLSVCGIGRRLIGGAVAEAQRRGLLDVRHGIGRAPSIFTLTFLPTFDSIPPSDRWREFVEVHEGEPVRYTKVHHKPRSSSPRCTATAVVVHHGEVHEGEHLSRKSSFQEGNDTPQQEGEAA